MQSHEYVKGKGQNKTNPTYH